jgi:hypothetical protein
MVRGTLRPLGKKGLLAVTAPRLAQQERQARPDPQARFLVHLAARAVREEQAARVELEALEERGARAQQVQPLARVVRPERQARRAQCPAHPAVQVAPAVLVELAGLGVQGARAGPEGLEQLVPFLVHPGHLEQRGQRVRCLGRVAGQEGPGEPAVRAGSVELVERAVRVASAQRARCLGQAARQGPLDPLVPFLVQAGAPAEPAAQGGQGVRAARAVQVARALSALPAPSPDPADPQALLVRQALSLDHQVVQEALGERAEPGESAEPEEQEVSAGQEARGVRAEPVQLERRRDG